MAEKVIGFKIQIEGLAGTIETATELKKAIAQVNAELKKTGDTNEIKKLEKQLVDLKAAQSLVNDITKEQIKLRKEELNATDKSEGAYRRLSKQLNDQRNRYKDLAAAEQESTQEAKDLLISIDALDKKLKGIDATVGQFQRNVGGYTQALGQFFPKLGGTVGQVTGLIGGLSQGITGLSATTGAFNKSLGAIGIALTAFSGISEIFQSINESVAETKELSNQVGAFTGATGNVLSDFVSKSQAIAKTYKKDVNEITVAANSASKSLGIGFNEALDAVEIGFRKGADSNNEFLDNLREYPTQFAAAGLSIKDYLAVAIAAANQGIYSDKGLDVVKEFGLRIREQTKTSKDALVDAFGEEFTGDLFNNLNDGSITTAEALVRVSSKMGDTSVAGNKLQTVIADVFGAAGEDAGLAYILSLEKILKNTDDVTKSTNQYQTQQEILFQTNLELEQSQSELNESFTKFGGEFTIISSKAKIFFNNLLGGLIDLANEFPATLKAMGAGLTTFFTTGSISQALKVNRDVFRSEKQKIDKEDKLAIEKAEKERIALEKQNAEEQKKRLKAQNKELSTTANKGGREVAKEYVDGSLAALENERGKLQSAFSNAVAGSGTQKELAVKLNAINVQIKDAVEQQNQLLADASRGNLLKNLQQAEQLTTLPLTTTPLKSVKASDLAKEEKNELKKTQDEIIKNSAEAAKKQNAINEQQLKDKKENTQKLIDSVGESILSVTNLIASFQQARAEKEAEAINEQITNTEKNIADLEAKAEKASGIRKKRIEKDIAAQKILLEQQQAEAEAIRLKAAKDEKKIAIIQAIIQGALAFQRALAQGSFLLAIPTGIAAAAQIATIAAQPLAEGGVVTGQRVNQKQNIPTRSNGDNVLAYVKRGEVVLNQRQQSLLGGSPTFRRIGIKGFAEGGIVPPISAPLSAISSDNGLSKYLQVIEAKTDAINNRIDRLQAYVVSDDIARDLAEGNKLKIKATL
jgi:hypothetical protein